MILESIPDPPTDPTDPGFIAAYMVWKRAIDKRIKATYDAREQAQHRRTLLPYQGESIEAFRDHQFQKLCEELSAVREQLASMVLAAENRMFEVR